MGSRRALAAAIAIAAALPGIAAVAAAASGNSRPTVVVVADNDGTETTDFLVPYGILAMSDAVEVSAASTRAGPVALHPALTVEVAETLDSFDATHPNGADFVVVPAMHERSDPHLVGWLKRQAERGTTLVAICDGVWTVAATGVLDGKRATGHWYSLDDLQAEYPRTTWVRNRRYVRDGSVITTTGVTASIPSSIALVEGIAGTARAQALAQRLGVQQWGTQHDSGRFSLSLRDVTTAARNWLAVWNHERVGIPVGTDTDEITLALTADALSRTYRTTALALSGSAAPLRLKHGIMLVPDAATGTGAVDHVEILPGPNVTATAALDRALASIEGRYGDATADFVALQIEYPERRLRTIDAQH
jgi:putative intracellular protease/amidase